MVLAMIGMFDNRGQQNNGECLFNQRQNRNLLHRRSGFQAVGSRLKASRTLLALANAIQLWLCIFLNLRFHLPIFLVAFLVLRFLVPLIACCRFILRFP